ncbi:MAG: virulence factor [bacterium]|nr:virulence factor [bacterium]
MMPVYQVLYWKNIPAQIRVFEGKRPRAFEMPAWFQQEIDRVATTLGLTGTDDYLNAWEWSEKRDYQGSIEEASSEILADLAVEYRKQKNLPIGE